ncbi:hypothetical protein A2U01_0111963, partial [Trifolium medium]|nr:hypothetical protein [Trifolium medium]
IQVDSFAGSHLVDDAGSKERRCRVRMIPSLLACPLLL